MINSIKHKVSLRFAAGAVGVAMAVSGFGVAMPALAAGLTQTQIQSILSLLQSFGADQATINNVNSALNGQATPGTGTGSTGGSCTASFTRDLTVGSTGADVMALQKLLNTNAATQVSASGAGSPGNETSTFGPATKAAVVKFQAANGVSPQSGYVGPLTRAKLNAMCGGTSQNPNPGTTPTPTPGTGTGLTVSAGAQPANGIAPNNAARIPFTNFTVTASNDGDVTLNSVTVQRTGVAQDAAFNGVELLDSTGAQIGITKTLNSNHQAVIGAPVVIPKGTSKTFTVAANRGSTSAYAGQIASFSVVAVNSSATVNGSLPISGANYTINEATSFIGTVTASRGSNDPGAATTQNVGTTNFIFSSIRLTAGSAEQVYLKSIRWKQVGTASASYLQNVVTLVDGVSYPTTVTSDNYYTTVFPGQGLLIDKGFSKDVAIQGDLVNGSNTTVEFDIQKAIDINTVGALYGYGILPAAGGNSCATGDTSRSKVCSTDDPYFQASIATVSSGIMTVSTSNAVSATNVAINQANQTIGGWSVQLQGEPVTVGSLIFNISSNSGTSATYADVTSVSLVDQNGSVLAGPVDATAVAAKQFKVTFTDTVTFPVGTTNIYLKGKMGTNYASNDTIAASTTPGTQWTTVTGQTTGRTITPTPSSALTSATMTIKAANLTVSNSSVPIAQTVIAGQNQFTFANYILDATASGEDVRVTTLPLLYTWTGNANDLTNCQLYNGSTKVSDQHVYNPPSATSPSTGSDVTYTLNSGGVVVPKGTSVTIALKCDLRSGASGTYSWGLTAGSDSSYTGATGVTSGSTATGSTSFDAGTSGSTMTASTGGTLSVTLDAGTPTYSAVSAGSTGVDLGHIRFSATNEDVDLRQVALKLTAGTRTDLAGSQVSLYDGGTNGVATGAAIATAVFPSGTTATSSAIASGAFRIPSNGYRILVIKGDMAAISASGPVTASGHTIKVDYDGGNVSGTQGTYGVGVASGSNRQPSSSSTSVNGVVVYKSYPTFTYSTATQTLTNGTITLLTLNVAADAKGDVRLGQLQFTIATTTVSVTSPTFTGPTGSVGTVTLNTSADSAAKTITVKFDSSSNTADRVVAAGTTKSYTMRGTVTGLTGSNSGSISIALQAATSTLSNPSTANGLASSTGATSTPNYAFNVWSPLSTTTTGGSVFDVDWTNTYGLGGCFTSVGLGQDCTPAVLSN